MEIKWVDVKVTVPEWGVASVHQLAANLASQAGAPQEAAIDDRFSPDAVRRAYYDVPYPMWRPFLAALAAKSLEFEDGCVLWPVLLGMLSENAAQVSGALGAAQKALGGKPPFDRRRKAGQSVFYMRRDVAEMIIGFKRDNEDEALRLAGEV